MRCSLPRWHLWRWVCVYYFGLMWHYLNNLSCTKTCNCQNGGSCDRFGGACRCAPGFMGPQCTQICPLGKFGPGCKEKCQCADHTSCDLQTGACRCGLGL